jgi:transcriptional regulator with XRE-family HTH domain
MSFTDRLEYLMKKNGINNRSELARVSGIPYTTIDGFYKKGTDNIKLSTLRKLAKCLHCSLDYLTEDSDVIEPQTLAAHFDGDDLTPEEQEEVNNFVKYVKSKRS